jgi:hypothetical protein
VGRVQHALGEALKDVGGSNRADRIPRREAGRHVVAKHPLQSGPERSLAQTSGKHFGVEDAPEDGQQRVQHRARRLVLRVQAARAAAPACRLRQGAYCLQRQASLTQQKLGILGTDAVARSRRRFPNGGAPDLLQRHRQPNPPRLQRKGRANALLYT